MGAGDSLVEEWRQVAEAPAYNVSNLGRVHSVDRRVWNGRVYRLERGRPMKQHIREGRVQVNLRRDDKVWSPLVHVLVAAAFLGARPVGFDVCHNDGDGANNRADNLRYGTRAQNESDKLAHGTDPAGERNGRHRLTLQQARDIVADTRPQSVIAAIYGVSQQAVSDIKTGRRWSRAMRAADSTHRITP